MKPVMTAYDPGVDGPGLAGQARAAARDIARLLRAEFDLARAEMAASFGRIRSAAVLFAVAATFSLIPVFLGVGALTLWLATLVGSLAFAAVIVAAASGLVALVAGMGVYRRLGSASLVPRRALKSLEADGEVMGRALGS